jgi:hypothetical protein
MPRQARGESIDPNEVQIIHAVQRCVRRAFLCGTDEVTGNSFEHRRSWIRDRIVFLASVFSIDILTYAVLSNHLHVVLRSRADVVAQWSAMEVARRWLRLFPKQRDDNGAPVDPKEHEITMIAEDAERVAEIRSRLSDVSWWMRCLAENIARRSNREEGVSGRFWEGRYRAQLILDEPSLLACAAYVDLNPVRAAMADSPEASDFTGAQDRIDDLRQRESDSESTHDWERSRRRVKSGWLSPVEIDERKDDTGVDLEPTNRRASRKGFLSISLTKYLELLDWTGRQVRADKRGSIPAHLAPILERLGIDVSGWCDLVVRFGKLFRRAAGTRPSISAEAERRGQNYMHAPGLACFTAEAV